MTWGTVNCGPYQTLFRTTTAISPLGWLLSHHRRLGGMTKHSPGTFDTATACAMCCCGRAGSPRSWVMGWFWEPHNVPSPLHVCPCRWGPQLSSWEATAPPGWVGAAQASPWRGEGQIESQIATCLLHLSYLFTQHFCGAQVQSPARKTW